VIIREDGIIRAERNERTVYVVCAAVVALGLVLVLLSWPWGQELRPERTFPLIGGIAALVTLTVVTYLRTRHVVVVEPGRVGIGDARRGEQWFERDQIRQITVRRGPVARITVHDLAGRRVLARGLAFHRAGELREIFTEAGLPLR
jgi:hypothetical protein